jgi:hypothetical protein
MLLSANPVEVDGRPCEGLCGLVAAASLGIFGIRLGHTIFPL